MNLSSPKQSNPSERILRQRPPRSLSFFMRITILCGGLITQIGALFFFIGMIVSTFMLPNSEVKYWLTFDGEWKTTTGKIVRTESTNASVNDRPVIKYIFDFSANGKRIESTSYGPFDSMLDHDATVVVEYKSGNPNNSRIEGMRREMLPGWIIFVLIFPITGSLLLLGGIFNNRKSINILKKGKFTRGTLLESRPTGSTVNNRPVMKYIFQFEAQNRTFTAECSTHRYHLVEDEEQEIILYDPKNPEKSIVYDAVPAVPPINQFGKFGAVPKSNIKYLIAPLLAIFSVVLCLIVLLF